MRRFLPMLAASLIGAPALAQTDPGDAAIRAGADFANYRAQADLQAAYAAQQQAQTALTLRKLELDRSTVPGFAVNQEMALTQDRLVVEDAQRRADAARLQSLETEARIREIDAWLNARRR